MIIRFSALFTAAVLIASAQTAAKKPVTIEDLLTAARARGLVAPIWSPNGQLFAYQQSGAVHLYDVRQKKSKEWFKPADLEKEAARVDESKAFGWQNRRVSQAPIQWFPNNKDVLVEAGDDLFVVRGNGSREQLTKTDWAEEDAQLSPDGKQILYRSRWNLYVLDIASKQARQLTADGTATLLNGQLDWVYPEELDLHTAAWWSPDSRRVAFLQFDTSDEFVYPQTDLTGERALAEPERFPQAGTPNAEVKLGVIELASGATRWMDLGDTHDALLARVYWLPDGSKLAVERMNRIQNQLDLLLADPASGASRRILHEESKTWINFTDNLTFLRSRSEFLWTSEAETGFRHLYRYSNDGKPLARLTNGDWEVKKIEAVDEAKGKVYYSSSEASPLEAQLYVVGFDGGGRQRLTREAGVHSVEMNDDGSSFTDAFSNESTPVRQLLKSSAGEELAVLHEADRKAADEFDLLPSEILTVTGSDGVALYGRLTKPAGFQQGVRYPLIVQVYGGPGVQTIHNDWQGLTMAQVFAHQGYLVWQMDNHGSSGRGHKFEEPIFRDMGTREVEDQKLGVAYLVKQGWADPARVGVTGWSYGGFMTIHCLLWASDVFKAGVAGAPVTDWHNYDTIYTERYMDLPANNAARYQTTSNVLNAEKLKGDLLILHNFEDDNVMFQNTLQMAAGLERAGKVFFMQIYPQKTHGVSGPYRKALFQSELTFFEQYLKSSPHEALNR